MGIGSLGRPDLNEAQPWIAFIICFVQTLKALVIFSKSKMQICQEGFGEWLDSEALKSDPGIRIPMKSIVIERSVLPVLDMTILPF